MKLDVITERDLVSNSTLEVRSSSCEHRCSDQDARCGVFSLDSAVEAPNHFNAHRIVQGISFAFDQIEEGSKILALGNVDVLPTITRSGSQLNPIAEARQKLSDQLFKLSW